MIIEPRKRRHVLSPLTRLANILIRQTRPSRAGLRLCRPRKAAYRELTLADQVRLAARPPANFCNPSGMPSRDRP
jgi:hypothetical protein